jgi:hypothetical protein
MYVKGNLDRNLVCIESFNPPCTSSGLTTPGGLAWQKPVSNCLQVKHL